MTTLMTQHFHHKMLFMTNFVLNMTLYFCHTKPFFVVPGMVALAHLLVEAGSMVEMVVLVALALPGGGRLVPCTLGTD